MAKKVQSWFKPDNPPNIIAIKKVDPSIFTQGINHIPRQFREEFVAANGGQELMDKQVRQVVLICEGKEYRANFRCYYQPNSAGVVKEQLSIRWDGSTELRDLLKRKFDFSYKYIISEQQRTGKTTVRVPDNVAEYIEFYKTDIPFTYTLVLSTSKSKIMGFPFSNLFTDPHDVRWLFQTIKKMLASIGINDAQSALFSLSFDSKDNRLTVNLQSGQLLSVKKTLGGKSLAGIACEDQLAQKLGLKRNYSYSQADSEGSIGIYEVEFSQLKNNYKFYLSSLNSTWRTIRDNVVIHKIVADPTASKELANAVFDSNLLEFIITHGVVPQTVEDGGVSQGPAITGTVGVDRDLVNDNTDTEKQIHRNTQYTIAQCAENLGLSEDRVTQIIGAIERKGQVVLFGAPGTGKTHAAKELAKVLLSGWDGFVDIVQFHPAYSYEEFIVGIRPDTVNGVLSYHYAEGRFVEFCNKSRGKKGKCVLIIDEINRANVSRVFGELMFLLEYRERPILLSNGDRFSIPGNVYLVGTMNTADRSIAIVDHALRRRFAFVEFGVNFELLRKYHEGSDFPIETLITWIKRINVAIGDKRYFLGISFFLKDNLSDNIQDIWTMEVLPYLEEYFFDQPARIEEFAWEDVEDSLL